MNSGEIRVSTTMIQQDVVYKLDQHSTWTNVFEQAHILTSRIYNNPIIQPSSPTYRKMVKKTRRVVKAKVVEVSTADKIQALAKDKKAEKVDAAAKTGGEF